MGPERITDLAAKCKLFGYLSLKEYDVERCVSCTHFLMAQIGWIQLKEKNNDSSIRFFFRTSTMRVNRLCKVKGRRG